MHSASLSDSFTLLLLSHLHHLLPCSSLYHLMSLHHSIFLLSARRFLPFLLIQNRKRNIRDERNIIRPTDVHALHPRSEETNRNSSICLKLIIYTHQDYFIFYLVQRPGRYLDQIFRQFHRHVPRLW